MTNYKDRPLPPLPERGRAVYSVLGSHAIGHSGATRTLIWEKVGVKPEDAFAFLHEKLIVRQRWAAVYPHAGIVALVRLLEDNRIVVMRNEGIWSLVPFLSRSVHKFNQPAFVPCCNILLEVLRRQTAATEAMTLQTPLSAQLVDLLLEAGHYWAEGLRLPWADDVPRHQTVRAMFDALVRRGLVKTRRKGDVLFVETKGTGRL